MTEANLECSRITSRQLKRKIESYVGSSHLSRDTVRLLLKQGAEDNNLFMIKEETYGKLVDALDLGLDQSGEIEVSDVSGMLASVVEDPLGDQGHPSRLSGLGETEKVTSLMKSRRLLRGKSVVAPHHNSSITEPPLPAWSAFGRESELKQGRGTSGLGEEGANIHIEESSPLPSPNSMEGRPKISNQSVINGFIVGCLSLFSLC